MKRRSKLSLSASQDSTKKRPEGFAAADAAPSPSPQSAQESHPVRQPLPPGDTHPTESHHASRKPPGKQPRLPGKPGRPSAPATGSQEAQNRSTWLNTGIIVKALLVVGATALSIFLLKRRVF